MKKLLFIALALISCSVVAQANPGDTTWVQANNVHLNYYNNFDTTVVFPDSSKTYRKIYMIFTLGQYNCPSGAQYCHQWDYTVENYVMTPQGDTFEMCRFITPFATSGWTRFGSSWKQPYVFDVTDFRSLLKDTATIRIHYSGYSGGFTANVKFAFIEGTPDRNVVGIAKLYDNSHRYGDTSNVINDAFPTLTETAPPGTVTARLKFLVTGHGNDNNGCCEFASHTYDVNLNGTSIAHRAIWRDDCGLNELYPQGGTWVYNRGNWCPGAKVRPLYDVLPNVTAGTTYNINIRFENYIGGGSFGSYRSSADVFYYGPINKTLDASIDDIIAPTDNPNHYRENPSGSIPEILVHNSGSTPITAIDFKYGITDSAQHSYSWTGNIAPLADTLITLPALQELTEMSINGTSGTPQFYATITDVNGQTDDDSTNNTMTSKFIVAPTWPGDLKLTLKTSNFTMQNGSIYLGNPNQKWVITDMQGNVIAARDSTQPGTEYHDQVVIPAPGFYKLTLTSDNGAGLHWWNFDQYSQLHQGFFTVAKMDNTLIPMRNYHYSGTSHDDWGSAYSQYFTVATAGTGINEVSFNNPVSIYPNPAKKFVNISFKNPLKTPVHIELINILGQTVYRTTTSKMQTRVNTQVFAPGVYSIRLSSTNGQAVKTQKLVISK